MAKNTDNGEVVEGQLPRRASYPWDVWTDGKKRRLTRGKHFFTSPHVFTTAVYNHCRRHNAATKGPKLEARCQMEDENHVVIQITKITAARKPKPTKPAEPA